MERHRQDSLPVVPQTLMVEDAAGVVVGVYRARRGFPDPTAMSEQRLGRLGKPAPSAES
jgi:hypothetical protein